MATTITANLLNIGTKVVGDLIGNNIHNILFSNKRPIYSNKIHHIQQQRQPEGEFIPNVYGTVQLAGTIIWTSDVKHYAKLDNKIIKANNSNDLYTISLAIVLCEGPISYIGRIWADGILIDKDNIRVYYGNDNQEPDPLLEVLYNEYAPSFKGLAYVVIQEFNITKFNNKIPNFTFEVSRSGINPQSMENLVESIVVIPGCGECVYDTKIHLEDSGNGIIAMNQHHTPGIANSVISLQQLKNSLPNIQWIAPVVSWFCNDLDAGSCKIIPKVEKQNILYESEKWKVAGITRQNAEMVSHVNGILNYGGTASDDSIIRYLEYIKSQKLHVMFYPMLFVDIPGKPWRGRINAKSGDDVRNFFNGENGYNRFILHYASLVKDYVSAFLIGSEMQELTRFQDQDGHYVAVDELVKLAAQVKAIVGDQVKVSYAANWSEYHSINNNYYMDKLWASKDIDFVGIDAYFPLSSGSDSKYDINQVINGWDNGELYDYQYENGTYIPLSPEYAKKNIDFWWENYHYNLDGTTSEWQPKMKKIWFTEYGFAAISCATNEPNVFIDRSTIESHLPNGSSGEVDILAQRVAITGTEIRWHNSESIERKFLWTWDARPYPIWPQLQDIWSDGENWQRGHWVNGKIGAIELRDVVEDLCIKAGIKKELLDVQSLYGLIYGLIIDGNQTAKNILADLQQIYNFDIYEFDGKIKFTSRYHNNIYELCYNDLLTDNIQNDIDSGDITAPLTIEVKYEKPSSISVNYIKQDFTISRYDLNIDEGNQHSIELDLPTIMSEEDVKNITRNIFRNVNDDNTTYDFVIAINSQLNNIDATNIQPGDLLKINYQGDELIMRVKNLDIREDNTLRLNCSKDSGIDLYNLQLNIDIKINNQKLYKFIPESLVEIVQVPKKSFIGLVASGLNSQWHGCRLSYTALNGEVIITEGSIVLNQSMIIGNVISFDNNINNDHFGIDYNSKLIIKLYHGQLFSISKNDLFLHDKNLIIVGNEIMKFSNAKLQQDGTYILTGFLRGLYGTKTECFDRFALLDMNILKTIDITDSINKINLKVETFLDAKQIRIADIVQEKSLTIQEHLLHPVRIIRQDNKISWTPRVITEDFFNSAVDHGFAIKLIDKNHNLLDQIYTIDSFYKIPNNIYNDVTEIMIAACQDNRIKSEFITLKLK